MPISSTIDTLSSPRRAFVDLVMASLGLLSEFSDRHNVEFQ